MTRKEPTNNNNNNNNNTNSSSRVEQRFPLRRSLKAASPSHQNRTIQRDVLIDPDQSIDFDFRDLQSRYLESLERILDSFDEVFYESRGADSTTTTATPTPTPTPSVTNQPQRTKMRNIHNLIIKTDDAFFELDDDEYSLPESPASPSAMNTPCIQLMPNSAPPFATQPPPTIHNESYPTSSAGTPTLQSKDSLLRTAKVSPAHSAVAARLQQSLSTPCNGTEDGAPPRKDSEYRRFKSEGSSAGATLPNGIDAPTMDELSPIDQRASSTARFSLMQQDSVVNPAVTKQSNTEQVAMMHTLKTKVSKYQLFVDRAMELINNNTEDKMIEGCTIITKLMKKAWSTPKVCVDLTDALCDYIRDREYFEKLIKIFIGQTTTCDQVKLACGRVLESIMSTANRDYVVNKVREDPQTWNIGGKSKIAIF
ncbi:unnamed protein product [Caenorhabditis bovis]|uniref:Uncharacterized protein n=1 Tax=Caenorhabditis bovis TaxID=2654633 RepID=A0A8S1EP99_9PELO|nr:unnamed protein product [Caenorhabditis bovis]